MKQKYLIIIPTLILMVWVLIVHKYVQAKNKEIYHGIVLDKRAPGFTLTGQNGTRVTLSQFRGELDTLKV